MCERLCLKCKKTGCDKPISFNPSIGESSNVVIVGTDGVPLYDSWDAFVNDQRRLFFDEPGSRWVMMDNTTKAAT